MPLLESELVWHTFAMDTIRMLQSALWWLWKQWKRVGTQLATVLAVLLFALMYIVVLGLYSLGRKAARVFRPTQIKNTYWQVKAFRKPSVQNLERPF